MYQFDPTQIERCREAAGLRRERIAVDQDRSAETIKLWEHGRVTPNARQIAKLADLLGCEVSDFYVAGSQ